MDLTPPPNDPLGAAFEQAKPTPDPDRAQVLEDALVARLYELKRQEQRKSNMQSTLTYPRPTARAWSGFITTAVTVAAFAVLTVALAFQTPPDGDDGYAAPVSGDLSQRETATPFAPTVPPQATDTPPPFEGQPTVPPLIITATPIPFEATALPPTMYSPLELTPTCRQMDRQGAVPQTIPWPQTVPIVPDPCGDGESFFILPDGSRSILELTPTPTVDTVGGAEVSRLINLAVSRLVTTDLNAPLDLAELSYGQAVVLYLPVLTSTDDIDPESIELSVELVAVGAGYITQISDDELEIMMAEPMLFDQNSRWATPDSRALIAVQVIEY